MTSTSNRRFVLLEHRTDPHHFDLMLEHEEALWTWSCYRHHMPQSVSTISFERLQDHRKAYLTYEGPVSGGRGTVRKVDTGTYRLDERNPGRCLAGQFFGQTWAFSFELTCTEQTGPRDHPLWLLRRTTDE